MTTPPRRFPPLASLPSWHVATSESVRAILATAAAPLQPPLTIGDVTLMPHQRDALSRIRTAIREFHGALLADEVGLGKTYVALALALDYDHTHVIAPAALLPMWRTAIARARTQHVQLHSLHAFSHSPTPKRRNAADPIPETTHAPAASSASHRRTLVIVDEAHHLRTRNTRRYHAVAEFVAGHDLLLLSATPLHNTPRELRSLLALFAGLRADLLTPPVLARLIVRHTATSRPASPQAHGQQRNDGPDQPPRVHEHPPLRIPHDRATLDTILTLPSPLPARDGAVAGALIRLGLLRAWCSSDAALTQLVRRRLLRGEALRQALLAGRHPTQAELRTWLVGDHEVQLAFPELLSAHSADGGPLLDVLAPHLAALQALLEHHERHRAGDPARARALRTIAAAHPGTPVIAFSHFTHTVNALYRALSDIAGVGALTGMHAHIASGRIGRLDAISRFAPTAQGRPPPPAHQAIRLLLSTDILAEGVNLQDAGVVVHLDVPWTDALRRQRVGRVARIGSCHPVVHVYQFAPHPDGDRALALTARLFAKATLSGQFVGPPATAISNTPPSLGTSLSPADISTQLHAELHAWTQGADVATAPTESSRVPIQPPHGPSVAVAGIAATHTGWLAAVADATGPRLVARTTAVGTEPDRIWQVVSATSKPAMAPDPTPIASQVAVALRQLLRWLDDRQTSDAAGPAPDAASRAQQHAHQRLAECVAATPPVKRRAVAAQASEADAVIGASTGVGAELALERWAKLAPTTAENRPVHAADWICAWRSFPALRRVHATPEPTSSPADATAPRILALLLLRRTQP